MTEKTVRVKIQIRLLHCGTCGQKLDSKALQTKRTSFVAGKMVQSVDVLMASCLFWPTEGVTHYSSFTSFLNMLLPDSVREKNWCGKPGQKLASTI